MAIEIEKPIQVFPGYEQLANVLQDALDQAQAGKGSQRHANGKPFLEQPIITDGRACGLAGPAFQARKKILEALNCPDEERAVQDLLGAIVYTAAMVILKEEERRKREDVPKMNVDLFEPWRTAISEQEAQVRAQVATSAQAKDTARDAMATSIRYAAPKLQFRGDDPNFGIIAIDGKSEPFSGGHVVCSGCGLKCSIGSEQEQSVNLTGRCTICRDEKERETYTVPPLDDGDDDPAVVHIVPDKTSRSTLPSGCLGMLCGRGGDDVDAREMYKRKDADLMKKAQDRLIAAREQARSIVDDEWRPCPND